MGTFFAALFFSGHNLQDAVELAKDEMTKDEMAKDFKFLEIRWILTNLLIFVKMQFVYLRFTNDLRDLLNVCVIYFNVKC